MANYLYAFSADITVDSTNHHLYFKDHNGNSHTATITSGTYDIVELCAAIDTAMTAVAGGDTYTVSMAWDSTYLCPKVKIEETDTSGNFELTCATSTDSIWDEIGFANGAVPNNRTGASNYTANYQYMYGWCSDHPPFFDSYDRAWITGGEPFVSQSGQLRRVTNPTNLYTREIDFGNVMKEKTLAVYATGYYTNQDFQTFWQTVARGTSFKLYISPDDAMTTASGTYGLLEPVGDLSRNTIARLNEAAEFYSWSMKMVKDPT